MREIQGVRAEPGGPVTMEFDGEWFRARPRRRGAAFRERWLDDGAIAIAMVVFFAGLGLTWLTVAKMHVPYALTAACGWTALAALLYAAIASMFTYPENWIGGLLLVPMLVIGLIALPFLLIPGFRRLLVRVFIRPQGARPDGSRPGWLSPAQLNGVWYEQLDPAGGCRVTIRQHDGTVVRYTAHGAAGPELHTRFEGLRTPR
ncbi:hypothetical protein [Streptacidiphilus carbonis]|uniref:hypothetical protein n=1 Tax=Streptacidiphilus carbonis TaxID=105422 RepID=UPI00126A77EC|nr:hypothetical protein [Streptacidiphilus carbonis]